MNPSLRYEQICFQFTTFSRSLVSSRVYDGISRSYRFQVVTSRGYVEDVRLSIVRLLIGTVIIGIALLAQFYPKKFPEDRDFLLVCIGLYPFLWSLLLLSERIMVLNGFYFQKKVFFSLWPWQVCSFQWSVTIHQLHKGEECDLIHLSSSGECFCTCSAVDLLNSLIIMYQCAHFENLKFLLHFQYKYNNSFQN